MDEGCRGGFIAESRTQLLEHYALDAFEELYIPAMEGWHSLNADQQSVIFDAVSFGVRAACIALGETGTYEQEYQAMLGKLQAQGNA